MLCIGIGESADPKGILSYLSRKTKQQFFRIPNGQWETVNTICSQLQSDFYIGVRTPSADLTVTTEYGTETFKLGQHVYDVSFGATFYIPLITQQCRIEVRFKESDGTSYIMHQQINLESIYNYPGHFERGLVINANWLEEEINKLKGDYGPKVKKLPTLNEQFTKIPDNLTYGNTNNNVTGTDNMTII